MADLANSGLEVSHPLLEGREKTERAMLLVLTANRGLCGGYNWQRAAGRLRALRGAARARCPSCRLEVSGKRGIAAFKFRGIPPTETLHALRGQAQLRRSRSAGQPLSGRVRRRQARPARRGLHAVREHRPAVGRGRDAAAAGRARRAREPADEAAARRSQYEFLPSAESILEEVVPTSFKVKLFKCFLDAAVSEQIARMVAMKAATENAGEIDQAACR